jgi:hypothetical protein
MPTREVRGISPDAGHIAAKLTLNAPWDKWRFQIVSVFSVPRGSKAHFRPDDAEASVMMCW